MRIGLQGNGDKEDAEWGEAGMKASGSIRLASARLISAGLEGKPGIQWGVRTCRRASRSGIYPSAWISEIPTAPGPA